VITRERLFRAMPFSPRSIIASRDSQMPTWLRRPG
jgi:hypothetical protein